MAESSSQELLEGMAALDSEGAAASRFDAIERALALQYETHEKIVGSTREVTKALRLMVGVTKKTHITLFLVSSVVIQGFGSKIWKIDSFWMVA